MTFPLPFSSLIGITFSVNSQMTRILLFNRTLPLAYGALLLILALHKAREFWRQNGFNGSGLVLVFIRDQSFYFAMCVFTIHNSRMLIYLLLSAIFCSIANLLNDNFGGSLFVGFLLTEIGSPTILCIVGSHIFFNLKEAGEHGVNIGTNWSSHSYSTVQFDEQQYTEHQSEYVLSDFFARSLI